MLASHWYGWDTSSELSAHYLYFNSQIGIRAQVGPFRQNKSNILPFDLFSIWGKKPNFFINMYRMCQDESAFRMAFWWDCTAAVQSRIWPSTLIAPNSRSTELILFRHELFSPSSPRSIKQGEFKFPSVSSSWVMRAEKLQPEQIGVAGFSSRPHIIKTAKLILLRVLKNIHL